MITLFEGLWPLSIDGVWRGVSPLPGSERSLKTARTRFAISQVQVAFGVYSSVISESYRFQESSRRYRKTVVLRNRSMFDSRNSNCFNLASNYVCRARCGIELRRTMPGFYSSERFVVIGACVKKLIFRNKRIDEHGRLVEKGRSK